MRAVAPKEKEIDFFEEDNCAVIADSRSDVE
jgi:hypothetical protein